MGTGLNLCCYMVECILSYDKDGKNHCIFGGIVCARYLDFFTCQRFSIKKSRDVVSAHYAGEDVLTYQKIQREVWRMECQENETRRERLACSCQLLFQRIIARIVLHIP